MSDETKSEIETLLMLLKNVLNRNAVSIGIDPKEGIIKFFDTSTYRKNNKMEGLDVKIQSLVGGE